MKKLKIIFNGLYFAYLFISVLMFVFKANLYQQMDLEFLLRFLNFWLALGLFFFIAVWAIQTVHIRLLRKDTEELEDELYQVKSKLYDASRPVLKSQASNHIPADSPSSVKTKNPTSTGNAPQ